MNSNPQSAVVLEIQSWEKASLPTWAKWVTAGGFVLSATSLGAKTIYDLIQAAQQKYEHDHAAYDLAMFAQSVQSELLYRAKENGINKD